MKLNSRIHKLYKIIFISFLLIAALPMQGQFRYGFRFGGDFASFRIKDAEGFAMRNRSGFAGGLVLEYQFLNFGLSPDISVEYARHNSVLKSATGELSSFGRNFIDIPIHIKYKFWIKSSHSLFAPMIYTGPVFSFRLDHNDALPLTSKKFQPGWDVGIGFDIINFIQITGGYRFGIGNSIKNFNGFPDASLKTDGWNIAATLLFDF